MAAGLAGLALGCGDDDGGGPADTGPGPDTGPMPMEDTGPMPMEDTGPMPMEDTGPMPMDVTCMEYCTELEANCGMMNSQYPVAGAECMDYCMTNAHWDTGTRGATDGNSLSCRAYHAEAAGMDADTHCSHAGPSGGNLCGTWCENYCQLEEDNCPGALSLYPDTATCMTACMAFATTGDPNDTSGNTVQCRIYHLGAAGASMDAAATHCPHGGAAGGPCS